jgi:acyl dehydratase
MNGNRYLTYADLTIGMRFSSVGRTITQTDLSMACMLSGDWHPIHADAEYAKTTRLGNRIVQGPFGILLAMGMSATLPEFADPIIGATGIREWRYSKPILVDATLRVVVEISSKRVTSDGGRAIVERRLTLIDQNEQTIQDGLAGTMIQLVSGSSLK